MFNFFKKQDRLESGIPDDDVTPVDENNYQQGEILATANAVVLEEKSPDTWRKFPIFSQNGSGSCVAQTLAKLLGIMYWLKNKIYVHFSATHIYQKRSNKPGSGMIGNDAFKIARQGVTLEVLVPSQDMSDIQMDSSVIEQYKEDVGYLFKVPNYLQLPSGDFDRMASTIQTTGKGVMVWFNFKRDEWTDFPEIKYPNLARSGSGIVRHSVAAVDVCVLNGVEGVVIEDSWGTRYGIAGQRFISREFFEARNFYTAYAMNFDFGGTPVLPPVYKFNQTLEYIKWNSATNGPSDIVKHNQQKGDVARMQNILKAEGFFPKNVDSTGYYGNITANALLDYQLKYKLDTEEELISLKGRIAGPKTRAKLSQQK